jgi:hypothetical protein
MLTAATTLTDPHKLIALTFFQDNVAASQTDVQLLVNEVASAAGNAVDGFVMPWPGNIVAISARLSAAATAGTLSVGPTINGTEQTDPTLAITTAASAYDAGTRLAAGLPAFAAGDLIGAEITTNGSWDGTSSDLAVVVFVVVDMTSFN